MTDVSFTCDMWSSVANDEYVTVTLHWLDEKWDMQTIIFGHDGIQRATHQAQHIQGHVESEVYVWHITVDKSKCSLT